MIRTWCGLLAFLLMSSIEAQYQRLVQNDHSLSADIALVDGKLEVLPEPLSTSSLIRDLSVRLDNGDVIIEFQMVSGENGQNYLVNVKARLDDQPVDIFREDLIGPISQEFSAEQNIPQQIVWTGLFDRYVDMNGRLTLTLSTELWGLPKLPYGIVCGTPPTFTTKQKLPYFIGAGVGLGALGASYLFDQKSKDTYDNEYLAQNFQEAAEPFYQKANDDHHTSLILRYAGTAILVVDAALYIYRSIRYGKKKDAYDEYCKDNAAVQLKPMVELANTAVAPGQVGFKLTYRFGQ